MEQLIMGAVALMLAIAVRRKEAFTWLKRSRPGFRKKLPVGEMPPPLFLGLNVLIYAFCFATLTLAARNGE